MIYNKIFRYIIGRFLKRIALIWALLIGLFPAVFACVDSAWIRVVPVSCNGLRDGAVIIDSVFGGDTPYYFTINGKYKTTRPKFDRLFAGTYTISIIPGHVDSCGYTVTVQVAEPELLQVLIIPSDTQIISGEEIRLEAQISPSSAEIATINWRPPYFFSNPHEIEQIVRPIENVEFTVEVRDTRNCSAQDRQAIVVTRGSVYLPNVFAPESLENAVFTVFSGFGVERIISMQIYNRTGALVFEDHNFLPNDIWRGWRGRWKNRPAPPGIYVWSVVIQYNDGTFERRTGDVTVMR